MFELLSPVIFAAPAMELEQSALVGIRLFPRFYRERRQLPRIRPFSDTVYVLRQVYGFAQHIMIELFGKANPL
jgi:hypothetical protein